MLINKDSRSWVVVCFLIFAAATAAYVPYARHAQLNGGPSGGTWYGIVYASVGSAMMLFALALGLKKRVRTMRIGRAYTWMQGHVWFGLLSYPVILYHSGFRFGGPFTQVIMWLFTVVVVSGIVGVLIQQYMPGKLLRDVQYETIYEQVDHVVEQLAADAERVVQGVVGRSGGGVRAGGLARRRGDGDAAGDQRAGGDDRERLLRVAGQAVPRSQNPRRVEAGGGVGAGGRSTRCGRRCRSRCTSRWATWR